LIFFCGTHFFCSLIVRRHCAFDGYDNTKPAWVINNYF
jgi:hypothetical protein